jgi:hypothetical protein
MAKLTKGYEFALTKFLASLPNRGDLLGRWLFFWEFRDPLFHAVGVGGADVMTERFPYEFGAGAVFLLADAL